MREDLKHEHWELTEKIIQCGINVHNAIGPGYGKSIYRNAMAIEMSNCGLKHEEEAKFKLFHREEQIGLSKADSLVEEAIILKYRARTKLSDENFTQEINQLKASKFAVGLLLNFGGKKLQFKRIYNNATKKAKA